MIQPPLIDRTLASLRKRISTAVRLFAGAAGYSVLREKGKAIDLLEQAYVERDLLLRYIVTGYEYDELRGDPRFVALTKRVGLGP